MEFTVFYSGVQGFEKRDTDKLHFKLPQLYMELHVGEFCDKFLFFDVC